MVGGPHAVHPPEKIGGIDMDDFMIDTEKKLVDGFDEVESLAKSNAERCRDYRERKRLREGIADQDIPVVGERVDGYPPEIVRYGNHYFNNRTRQTVFSWELHQFKRR
jgi:hypothetical protein